MRQNYKLRRVKKCRLTGILLQVINKPTRRQKYLFFTRINIFNLFIFCESLLSLVWPTWKFFYFFTTFEMVKWYTNMSTKHCYLESFRLIWAGIWPFHCSKISSSHYFWNSSYDGVVDTIYVYSLWSRTDFRKMKWSDSSLY